MLELRLISLKDWSRRQGKALPPSSVPGRQGEKRGESPGAQPPSGAEKEGFYSCRGRVGYLCVPRAWRRFRLRVGAQWICVGWVVWHGMEWKRKLGQRQRASWKLYRFGNRQLLRCWGPYEPAEAPSWKGKEMREGKISPNNIHTTLVDNGAYLCEGIAKPEESWSWPEVRQI